MDEAPKDNGQSKSNSGGYPVKVGVVYPKTQSRMMALFSLPFFFIRAILLIPHFIIIYVLSIVSIVAVWLNFWVVLFTGSSSKGLYSFIVGVLRWQTRMNGYFYGLTDKYPPFNLNS